MAHVVPDFSACVPCFFPAEMGRPNIYLEGLIGTPSRRWGWILARNPHSPEARIQVWLAEMAAQGYDPAQL